MKSKKKRIYAKGFFLLLILVGIIGCLEDKERGLSDAKSGQSQKASVFTTASKQEIQAFIKEKRVAVTQEGKTNGSEEKVISPLRYVKLFGQEAEAGILRVSRGDKIAQWVFYKLHGELQANRVRAVRLPGTDSISSFTGVIEVSELKGIRWARYLYKKDTLKKVYSGNGLLSKVSNQCESKLEKLEEIESEGHKQLADTKREEGDCGGGSVGDGGEIGMVVVTGHRRSSGSSSGSSGTGWGGGGSYPSFPSRGSGVGGGDPSFPEGGSGGGGSYSGDDGESYYGGKIDTVIVKGRKKVKTEEEEEDSDKSLPLLPLDELVDEKGEPLKEKQDPPEKKEEDKDKKEPCKTTVEDLQKVFPNTDSDTLKEIADLVNEHGKDFGLDSKEKLQHFLAQAGEETYQLKTFHEYTNYRLSLLGTSKTYWSRKFNTIKNPTADSNKENPNDYANPSKPGYADGEKLLNFVYQRKDLGNTQPGDGYKYRGRGILQLTGRANYTAFNAFYQKSYDSGVDVLAHPELLNDNKAIGVISGLWYFKNKVLSNLDIDDKTSVKAITEKINGGINGINERKALHNKAKTNIKCH